MKNILKALVVAVAALFVVTSVDARPQPKPKAPKPEYVTTKYSANVDCPSCSKKVDHALKPIKGVKSSYVDLRESSVTVRYDRHRVNTEDIKRSLDRVGIRISPYKPAPKPHQNHKH